MSTAVSAIVTIRSLEQRAGLAARSRAGIEHALAGTRSPAVRGKLRTGVLHRHQPSHRSRAAALTATGVIQHQRGRQPSDSGCAAHASGCRRSCRYACGVDARQIDAQRHRRVFVVGRRRLLASAPARRSCSAASSQAGCAVAAGRILPAPVRQQRCALAQKRRSSALIMAGGARLAQQAGRVDRRGHRDVGGGLREYSS